MCGISSYIALYSLTCVLQHACEIEGWDLYHFLYDPLVSTYISRIHYHHNLMYYRCIILCLFQNLCLHVLQPTLSPSSYPPTPTFITFILPLPCPHQALHALPILGAFICWRWIAEEVEGCKRSLLGGLYSVGEMSCWEPFVCRLPAMVRQSS